MKKHIILAEIVAAILVAAIFAVVCGRASGGALEIKSLHDQQVFTADQYGRLTGRRRGRPSRNDRGGR